MVSIKNILVPTDFSDSSKIALDYALSMAQIFKSKVFVMHVYEPVVYYTDVPMGMPDIVEMEQSIRSSSESALNAILEKEVRPRFSDVSVEKILTEGKPFVEIIRTAREKQIDLIVLSSHGRGFLEHMLLGSVTEKVVRKAPCPVLTVRSQSQFKMP